MDYCRRKVLLVKDKLEQMSGLVRQRQAALAQVEALLEQRAASRRRRRGSRRRRGPPPAASKRSEAAG